MSTLRDVLAGIGLFLVLMFVDALLAIIEARPIEALRRFVMRGVCCVRGHVPGVVPVGYAHPYYHRVIRRRICRRCHVEVESAC